MPHTAKSRTLREMAQVLFTRWPGFVLIVAALTGGAYYACTYATRLYRSSVTLCIGHQPTTYDSRATIETLPTSARPLALSDRVLARTCALIAEPVLRQRWMEAHRADRPIEQNLRNDVNAAAQRYLTGEPADRRALRRFRSRVEVTPAQSALQPGEHVVTIQVEYPAPPSNAQMAAEVLAQVVTDRFCELQAERSRAAVTLLQQQLAEVQANMVAPARQAFGAFVKDAGIEPADAVEWGQTDADKWIEFQALRDDWQQAREHYRQLQMELAAAQTRAQPSRQSVAVLLLDGPNLPNPARPAWPNRWLFTLTAGIAGLLLATAYALLGYRFDHTLRNAYDVERFIGVPVLGSVRRRRGGLI